MPVRKIACLIGRIVRCITWHRGYDRNLDNLAVPDGLRYSARFARGVIAVSYTHLDVYKRQGKRSGVLK